MYYTQNPKVPSMNPKEYKGEGGKAKVVPSGSGSRSENKCLGPLCQHEDPTGKPPLQVYIHLFKVLCDFSDIGN
jgi:hypothetical protein